MSGEKEGPPEAPLPPLDLPELLRILHPFEGESTAEWEARVAPIWEEKMVREALFVGLVERGRERQGSEPSPPPRVPRQEARPPATEQPGEEPRLAAGGGPVSPALTPPPVNREVERSANTAAATEPWWPCDQCGKPLPLGVGVRLVTCRRCQRRSESRSARAIALATAGAFPLYWALVYMLLGSLREWVGAVTWKEHWWDSTVMSGPIVSDATLVFLTADLAAALLAFVLLKTMNSWHVG